MDLNYKEILEKFNEQGFAVVEGFLEDAEVDELRAEMGQIVDRMDPADHPHSIFTTDDKQENMRDEYFLNSSDKIRFFYEEDALNKDGQLVVDKSLAFNKVGHGLHILNDVFRRHTFSLKLQNLVRSMGFTDPAVVQSMYIFKQPKIGGAVTPHIDATFLYVEPIKHLVGVWIPLEDATLENGCLSFVPGSHKVSELTYRFVRNPPGSGKLLSFRGEKPPEWAEEEKYVPVPVTKGSCVLIHGLVVHKSEPNRSTKSRHVYTFHVVERAGTTWSPENWLQLGLDKEFPKLYTTN